MLMTGLFKKDSCIHKTQKPLEICKYTQDSSWFISISLENWMKSLEKQVYCTHLFLSNQNSNNSNMTQWSIRLLKNDNWTITPFSHISLMPQVSTTIKKNKSFKEKNNQSTHKVWLRCMSDHEWLDITKYNLIMSQKSNDKIMKH